MCKFFQSPNFVYRLSAPLGTSPDHRVFLSEKDCLVENGHWMLKSTSLLVSLLLEYGLVSCKKFVEHSAIFWFPGILSISIEFHEVARLELGKSPDLLHYSEAFTPCILMIWAADGQTMVASSAQYLVTWRALAKREQHPATTAAMRVATNNFIVRIKCSWLWFTHYRITEEGRRT